MVEVQVLAWSVLNTVTHWPVGSVVHICTAVHDNPCVRYGSVLGLRTVALMTAGLPHMQHVQL
jgi:hypothetical protein